MKITRKFVRARNAVSVWESGFSLMLVVMLFCGGCGGGRTSVTAVTTPASVATPSPFVVYDNTNYPNSSAVLETLGTMRAAVLYSQTAWPGTCSATGCPNAPTQAVFQASLQTYVKAFGSSSTIIFDYENLVVSKEASTAAANNAVTLLLQMIAWTRAIYPNAKIGMYDYDWNSNYIPSSSSGFNAIRAQLFKGGAASFDFFAPTMYQRWTTHALWDQNLAQSIISDTAINQANGINLPIYPYISPYVSAVTADGLLTDLEWNAELADLASCNAPTSSACGAVLSTLTPAAGSCSAAGSATACSPVSGGVLWTQGTSANLDSTSSWIQNLSVVLSPTVSPNVIYQIVDAAQSPLCIDTNAGTVPSANACNTLLNQGWMFSSLGTGLYTVKSFSYQQANPSTGISEVWDGTNGTVVLSQLTSSGTATANQQWQVVSLGNGYYEFIKLADYSTSGNTDSEECLTVGLAQQILTTSVCNSSVNQEFRLIPE
ncbi:MAG: hypothetical protein PW792_14545 [Acidobacteriaceae bacterium]|nr:hypothetical protein [Acidobacteriaceae bacterium]